MNLGCHHPAYVVEVNGALTAPQMAALAAQIRTNPVDAPIVGFGVEELYVSVVECSHCRAPLPTRKKWWQRG